jgi:hypothetical protein
MKILASILDQQPTVPKVEIQIQRQFVENSSCVYTAVHTSPAARGFGRKDIQLWPGSYRSKQQYSYSCSTARTMSVYLYGQTLDRGYSGQ